MSGVLLLYGQIGWDLKLVAQTISVKMEMWSFLKEVSMLVFLRLQNEVCHMRFA